MAATYYVDVEQIATGTGTALDPYNFAQFAGAPANPILVADDTVFNVKGSTVQSYQPAGNAIINLYSESTAYNVTIQSWLDTPARIQFNHPVDTSDDPVDAQMVRFSSSTGSLTIKRMILEYNKLVNWTNILSFSLVRQVHEGLPPLSSITLENCIFVLDYAARPEVDLTFVHCGEDIKNISIKGCSFINKAGYDFDAEFPIVRTLVDVAKTPYTLDIDSNYLEGYLLGLFMVERVGGAGAISIGGSYKYNSVYSDASLFQWGSVPLDVTYADGGNNTDALATGSQLHAVNKQISSYVLPTDIQPITSSPIINSADPSLGLSVDVMNASRTTPDRGACEASTAGSFPIITAQPASISKSIGETGYFSVTATGMQPLTYEWRKNGAGLTGSTLNEYVLYPVTDTDGGNYNVYVTETGGITGANSDVATLTINPPVANFTADVTSGTTPLTVNFTDTSTNTPTSWAWDFGDTGTSTSQNPQHIYSTPGTYTVALTATNAGGSNTNTKTSYITAIIPAPVANFTATPTSGAFPLTVNFTDTSTNTPTSWAWDFGDGSPIVTDQSPQYIYDIDSGTFTVTLTVTNAGGSDIKTRTNYITVNAIAPTITTQPASQIVALSSNVTFSVVAVATPPLTDLTYQWQKGDVNIAGATSSSLTLSHVLFTDQNNYRVVVTDAGGFVNSNEATLTVIDTKKAGASNNPDDRVGMPKANDEVSGTQVKDTNLGTGYGGNTLELGKINHIGLILRDTQDGSSDGPRARNNENTNGVKGLLPRMAELVQTITTFFYKVR